MNQQTVIYVCMENTLLAASLAYSLTLNMQTVVYACEMFVNFYQTIQHHVAEECTFHTV